MLKPAAALSALRPTNLLLISLTTAEMLVVASLRLRLQPQNDTAPDWTGGLRAAGFADIDIGAFDAFVRYALAGRDRAFDIRCPKCPRLGEDEARFLQCVGFMQREDHRQMHDALAKWLTPAAARVAMFPGEEFAQALSDCGLVIPLGPDDIKERRMPAREALRRLQTLRLAN